MIFNLEVSIFPLTVGYGFVDLFISNQNASIFNYTNHLGNKILI